MPKANPARKGAKISNITLTHKSLCALKAASAELSAEAGKMLSYEEAILELLRRHADRKGAVS